MTTNSKQKIAVVYSDEKSPWGSCISISANLRAAYALLDSSFALEMVPFNNDAARCDLRTGNGYYFWMAEKLLSRGVTKISIVDHDINILPLLLALKTVNSRQTTKIHFVFHVYGDFTLYSDHWQQLGQELKGMRVTLLCASERQRNLVQFFEKESRKSSVELCPFPVDTQYFQFSSKAREQWREKIGVKDQHLAIYTGRVSLQKGVLALIQEFHRQQMADLGAVLAIAGACDDIGGPTNGIKLQPGYFFQRLTETLSTLPPTIRNRVHLLGALSKEDLCGLYSAADSFISLSLYHDEDFGMSPAEALSTGLPCLLTDWGGYSSFVVTGACTQLISVNLTDRGLAMDHAQLRAKWREILKLDSVAQDRLRAGNAFACAFSIANVAEQLKAKLCQPIEPFSGFNWQLSALKIPEVFQDGLYNDVYGKYVAPKAEANL